MFFILFRKRIIRGGVWAMLCGGAVAVFAVGFSLEEWFFFVLLWFVVVWFVVII